MNLNKLSRTVHNWISIFIALPLLLIIVSGLFLQLKKDFQWIQPSSVRGANAETPTVSHEKLLIAATSVAQTKGLRWSDFDRIDYKTDRGMVKFITVDGWEVQVDTTNAEVLSVASRQSDFLEKLHDGSYFGDFVKYCVILPTGITLFVLWVTGLWMFIYPHLKKASNKKKKALKASKQKA